jgi:hypothetical protein
MPAYKPHTTRRWLQSLGVWRHGALPHAARLRLEHVGKEQVAKLLLAVLRQRRIGDALLAGIDHRGGVLRPAAHQDRQA